MAKSGKEDAKDQAKEGEKGSAKMEIEGESKSKDVAPKPLDPVAACLHGLKFRGVNIHDMNTDCVLCRAQKCYADFGESCFIERESIYVSSYPANDYVEEIVGESSITASCRTLRSRGFSCAVSCNERFHLISVVRFDFVLIFFIRNAGNC
jgi:hypothetical protein